MSIAREDYYRVQMMLEQLGSSLFDLVNSLITRCELLPNFPRSEVHKFIDSYECLYFFEKEKNLAPRFSRAA